VIYTKGRQFTDETTDRTTSHLTDKATSHSTRLSKDDNQVAGYNPAKDAGQVIGYSHPTDETPSHSTRSPKDGNQVAGYKQPAEELLMEPLAIRLSEQTTLAKSLVMAGHPKDGCQVVGYIRQAGCGIDTRALIYSCTRRRAR
jgi:hypothetical protein